MIYYAESFVELSALLKQVKRDHSRIAAGYTGKKQLYFVKIL